MSDGNSIIRGTARAAVGVVVVAVSASAALLIGNTELPGVVQTPPAIDVDTTQNAARTVVCAGSFSELGGDPSRPGASIPVGAPTLTVAGDADEPTSLGRTEGGDGQPSVLTAPSDQPLGAAQWQALNTETLRGVAASSCAEPVNEQWLLGGSTGLGSSTTLSLGNPGDVPATVQITLYDENGQVASAQTAAVLVAPGAQQTVSLNGYAPDRERLAVRVVSTGAPVTANLGVSQLSGLDPNGVSTVSRQLEPASTLVVPGVANIGDRDVDGPGDVGPADDFSVLVRLVAPGGESGTARVRAIDASGKSTDLGSVKFESHAVSELPIAVWPKDANAVVIEADAPLVGSVLGSAHAGDRHDFAWFAAAPEIEPGQPFAVPVVGGGQLVVVNTGEEEATVEVTNPAGKTAKTVVKAGAAAVVAAPSNALLESSAPIRAGVRYATGGDIDGYPILSAGERDGALTVYTR